MNKGRSFKINLLIRAMAWLFLIYFLFISSPGYTDAVGPKAIDFSLKDINGEFFTLSDYKGQDNMLLLFWTTWCPNCQAALRGLNSEKKNYKLVTINIGEPRERVIKFMKRYNYDFLVLLDEEASVAFIYDVLGIPTYIVVDPDFRISYRDYVFPSYLERNER